MFRRFVNAITWKNIVTMLRFLNVTDTKTGTLSPAKVLTWAIAIGISVVMFSIGDVDLGAFAGGLMTLVAAFVAVYSLSIGKKIKMDGLVEAAQDELEKDNDRRHRHHDRPYGIEEPNDEGPTP